MCEINPKHSKFFRLEIYTSSPTMPREKFLEIISERLIKVEMELNKPGDIRVHIHEANDD